MHINEIYYKYFLNKLAPRYLYDRSFTKKLLLTKKMHVLIQLQINNWFKKKNNQILTLL